MIQKAQKWEEGAFFILDAFEYRPVPGTAWLRFKNRDTCELPVGTLWHGRSGRPDWRRARIDPQSPDVLLVPTFATHPAIEGSLAEIPGDVIRSLTDDDYRAFTQRLAAQAKRRAQPNISRRPRRRLEVADSIPTLIGSYVIWLERPIVRGKGHFCHFSWKYTSFRIRDYITHELYHQEDVKPTTAAFWEHVIPTALSRDEVWKMATARLKCTGSLHHPVSDFDWWSECLKSMTARQRRFPMHSKH